MPKSKLKFQKRKFAEIFYPKKKRVKMKKEKSKGKDKPNRPRKI